MSHLNAGCLNLALLRDVARSELLAQLDSIEGSKVMVWDSKLIGPFGLISDYSLLKEHKVTQMLEIRAGPLPNINASNVLYFIRPKLSFISSIAENIKSDTTKRLQNVNLHLIFVPRKCTLCERKLEVLGVYGDFVSIGEYNPDFFVFDSDLISLERPLAFRECQLETDFTALYQIARSLMTFQCLYGFFSSIAGIGPLSKSVHDIMMKLKQEISGIEPTVISQVDQLILIDRSIDLLTPMTFQVSYEAILDEIYGINQTVVRLPPEKFLANTEEAGTSSDGGGAKSLEPATEMKRFYLNSAESLFTKLRDCHYLSVGPILRASAQNLASQFDERKFAKTVHEIRKFVDKIPQLQKLRNSQANHTSMAELIREFTDTEDFHEYLFCENEFLNCFEIDTVCPYIETCISRGQDLVKILRLISIQSFCANGLKTKVLDFYKREILQTYGYQHLVTLQQLESAGIIRQSGGYGWTGRSYSGIRNRLKLTWNINQTPPVQANSSSSGANGNHSHDIGHLHNGYTPLSVRIVQHFEQFGLRSLTDVLQRNLIKSDVPIFDQVQSVNKSFRKQNRFSDSVSQQSSADTNQKIVIVFYIGGCTFSELASFRLLSQRETLNTEYVVGATSMINGKTLLQSLVDFDL